MKLEIGRHYYFLYHANDGLRFRVFKVLEIFETYIKFKAYSQNPKIKNTLMRIDFRNAKKARPISFKNGIKLCVLLGYNYEV